MEKQEGLIDDILKKFGGDVDEETCASVAGISVEEAEEVCEKALALYDDGKFEEAFELWKSAADKGNPAAQFHVAVCYKFGEENQPRRTTLTRSFIWVCVTATATE